jgi:hypothetical protein
MTRSPFRVVRERPELTARNPPPGPTKKRMQYRFVSQIVASEISEYEKSQNFITG